MDVPCRGGPGQCLLFLHRNPLLQEGKEVNIWVTAALLWMEVEVYNISVLYSKVKFVDTLIAIKFTGETLSSTLQFYSGRMSPSALAGAMQRELRA